MRCVIGEIALVNKRGFRMSERWYDSYEESPQLGNIPSPLTRRNVSLGRPRSILMTVTNVIRIPPLALVVTSRAIVTRPHTCVSDHRASHSQFRVPAFHTMQPQKHVLAVRRDRKFSAQRAFST